MTEGLRVIFDGSVCRITIDRPEDKNRVTSAMVAAIIEALAEAGRASRLVVIGSIGETFCGGWLGPAGGLPAGSMEAYEGRRQFDVVFECYAAIRNAPIPVIAAVRGAARGFGCAIAGVCDLTIAADSAAFQVPEMAHNVLPTMVAWALRERVPAKALAYLAYSTDEIGAAEALRVGIASRVVPLEKLDAEVERIVTFLLQRPAPAVNGLKEFLTASASMDARGSLDFARSLHATINTSSEMRKRE